MIVAIDGPAGSGKSTVAQRLAARLGFEFLNTGAMYRAVALRCVRESIDPDDLAAVATCAEASVITFPENRPHLDGEDVTDELRTEPVSAVASRIALNPQVRTLLVDLQRAIADDRDVVTEGRDQGTIVFPHAEMKFFLTASAETRAARRYGELAALEGHPPDDVTYASVLAQIRDRDARDRNRPLAPLKAAADAVVFDTSDLTVEQAVDQMERIIIERRRAASAEADG
ncbi:MAG: (d)CMP kinase [Planctomycetaceae bacterium]